MNSEHNKTCIIFLKLIVLFIVNCILGVFWTQLNCINRFNVLYKCIYFINNKSLVKCDLVLLVILLWYIVINAYKIKTGTLVCNYYICKRLSYYNILIKSRGYCKCVCVTLCVCVCACVRAHARTRVCVMCLCCVSMLCVYVMCLCYVSVLCVCVMCLCCVSMLFVCMWHVCVYLLFTCVTVICICCSPASLSSVVHLSLSSVVHLCHCHLLFTYHCHLLFICVTVICCSPVTVICFSPITVICCSSVSLSSVFHLSLSSVVHLSLSSVVHLSLSHCQVCRTSSWGRSSGRTLRSLSWTWRPLSCPASVCRTSSLACLASPTWASATASSSTTRSVFFQGSLENHINWSISPSPPVNKYYVFITLCHSLQPTAASGDLSIRHLNE